MIVDEINYLFILRLIKLGRLLFESTLKNEAFEEKIQKLIENRK